MQDLEHCGTVRTGNAWLTAAAATPLSYNLCTASYARTINIYELQVHDACSSHLHIPLHTWLIHTCKDMLCCQGSSCAAPETSGVWCLNTSGLQQTLVVKCMHVILASGCKAMRVCLTDHGDMWQHSRAGAHPCVHGLLAPPFLRNRRAARCWR